jgi:hypothetical protein
MHRGTVLMMRRSAITRALNRHRLPALVIVLVAALTGLGVGVLLGDRDSTALVPGDQPLPSPTPTADASETIDPRGTATSSPSPPAATLGATDATPSPGDESSTRDAASTDLSWTRMAAFGEAYGRTSVNQIAAFEGGIVAVGVERPNPVMPDHDEGRVWASSDGREWADVTPPGLFADTSLVSLIVADDGGLIVFGTRSSDGEDGYNPSAMGAWESRDGRSWQPTEIGFPELMRAPRIASGARGHVALVGESDYAPRGMCPKIYCGFELWYSPDGRRWGLVRSHDLDFPRVVVDAGDEGFVVAGIAGPAGLPFVVATGDGRQWYEAAVPPADIIGLAAMRGDWLVASSSLNDGTQPPTVWRSANGLDWLEIGHLPLGSIVTHDDECRERAKGLLSAGPWLISTTGLDYPCVDVHRNASLPGKPRLSLDGVVWVTLPLAEGPGQSESGAGVSAALASGDRLLLAVESDGRASFWLGEP